MKRKQRKKKDGGFLVPKMDIKFSFEQNGNVDMFEEMIFERASDVRGILEELDENDMNDTIVYNQYENELFLLMTLLNIHGENKNYEK